MTIEERKADFKIILKHKGLSPVAINKMRIAMDQYNLKTRHEQSKLKRRINKIAKEDRNSYEN
jgi:hypothetical protein